MKLRDLFALLLFALVAIPTATTAKEETDPEVLADMRTDISQPDDIVDYKTETYKTVGKKSLIVRIYSPDKKKFKGTRPAVVIYHGGGWSGGNPNTFIPHARYFRDNGFKVFVATYRLANKELDSPTPINCLLDAKSAMRYVRANAKRFDIYPDKIAASGGSAGAHLSAAIALIDKYNEESDDLSVSCIPNALVLFSPVIDNGQGGWSYDRVSSYYKDFSPLHNIRKGMPPVISFLGTKDSLIPVVTMQYFNDMINRVGTKSELYIYEGQGHGFFKSKEYFPDVMSKSVKFLGENGIIAAQ